MELKQANCKIDKKSKINSTFFALGISASLWAVGYAFMLTSPNIYIANLWRLVSALGWCFFTGIWMAFAFSLKNQNQRKPSLKIRALIQFPSISFNNFFYYMISLKEKI